MCQNNNQLEPIQSEQQVEMAAQLLLSLSLFWAIFINPGLPGGWLWLNLLIKDLLVPQKNVQTLQTAVDSLQKEKDELVLALQSAKKDTNQAKYV